MLLYDYEQLVSMFVAHLRRLQKRIHTQTHDIKYLYWKLPVSRLIYKTITQTG